MSARPGTMRLREAVERGDGDAVQEELDAGVPVDAAGRTRWTPLHRDADRGHVHIVRILCAANANPNIRTETGGDTPLHIAAAKGDSASVAELLRVGADPRLKAKNGWTPLHAAMFYQHEDAVRVLMRNGADPTNLDSSGLTANDIALAQQGYSRASPPDGAHSSDHLSPRRRRKAGLEEGGAMSPGRERLLEALKLREEEQLRTAERRREAAQLREQQDSDAQRAEDMERLRRKHERRQDLQATLRIRSPMSGRGQGLAEISTLSSPDDLAAPDVSAISFAGSSGGDGEQMDGAGADYDDGEGGAGEGGQEEQEDAVIYCE